MVLLPRPARTSNAAARRIPRLVVTCGTRAGTSAKRAERAEPAVVDMVDVSPERMRRDELFPNPVPRARCRRRMMFVV